MPAIVIRFVDGKARTYPASRIRATTILDTPVERPDDFDLATFWRESSAEFRAALSVEAETRHGRHRTRLISPSPR